MLRTMAITGVLAIFFGISQSADAHQNPQHVAERCVAQVRQIVVRCENAAAQQTTACLLQVRELLAAGRKDLAIIAVRECLKAARERTRLATAEVREICGRCVDYLQQIGEHRLAARVRNLCAEAIEAIENLLLRQEHALRTALDGGGP